MGVPAFYRWLSEKYPKIVKDLLEKRKVMIGDTEVPVDLAEANPNNIEFDNLYIDMNGIIHPCAHPEDREPPKTEADMYINVTKYVDRLFAAVRPRRLLFLAIDGVAPRAKMNQQRSRRFRAAQEAKEREEMMQEVISEMQSLGLDIPPSKGAEWDSNVITPGTGFMDKLSIYLWFYVIDKMNRDPYWRTIKVIISDASVPGEGEHKIMKFIRSQRCHPHYDPNQRHVLHGLDADLIMLALATHEVHFTILREEIIFNKHQKEKSLEQARIELEQQNVVVTPEDEWIYNKRLQCLHIDILREYLHYEFISLQDQLPFTYDLERLIDDFVFLCFFVGNDFLPHLPSLDIRDGAIDFLMLVYKEMLPSLGGYITSPGGDVNLTQVDVLLARVGEIEDEVFKIKKVAEDAEAERRSRHQQGPRNSGPAWKREKEQGRALLQHAAKTQRIDSVRAAAPFPVAPATSVPNLNDMKAQLSETLRRKRESGNNANASAAQMLRQQFMKKTETSTVTTLPTETAPPQVVSENTVAAECEVIEIIEDAVEVNNDAMVVEEIERMEESLAVPEEVKQESEKEDITGQKRSIDAVDDAITENNSVSDDEDDLNDTESDSTVEKDVINTVKTSVKEKLQGEDLERAVGQLTNRIKNKKQEKIEANKETIKDEIKFYEDGWKDRYYGDKFKKEDIEAGGGFEKMRFEYIRGLCWVLKYYYQGCPSWSWYYPFHYAPFASDLKHIDKFTITFTLSEPFSPTEQLLSVLPADSVHALPESCQWLMTDKKSPIIDLYDPNFPIDPNGKVLPWLWVLLLPFVDEQRIKDSMKLVSLSAEEKKRNSFGRAMILMHESNPLKQQIPEYKPTAQPSEEYIYSFDGSAGNGIGGHVWLPTMEHYAPLEGIVTAPTRPLGAFRDISSNHVMCYDYDFPEETFHDSVLLPNAIMDPFILDDYDVRDRKPPRLNKSKFSIVDIANRHRPAGRMIAANVRLSPFTDSFGREVRGEGQRSVQQPRANYSQNRRISPDDYYRQQQQQQGPPSYMDRSSHDRSFPPQQMNYPPQQFPRAAPRFQPPPPPYQQFHYNPHDRSDFPAPPQYDTYVPPPQPRPYAPHLRQQSSATAPRSFSFTSSAPPRQEPPAVSMQAMRAQLAQTLQKTNRDPRLNKK